MFLSAEGLGEDDTGLCFGGGWSVTRAVGAGLNDMHHAVFGGIAADIERVCSHQDPAYRINARVKFHFSHT